MPGRAVLARWSAGPSEVVHVGDAKSGEVLSGSPAAAVAQDLPGLPPSQDVLDPGADPAVGGVVFLLSGRQRGLTELAAVRDEQAGAPVAPIGNHGGGPRCLVHPGGG